jgi:Flp pilus assembly protein CpaB
MIPVALVLGMLATSCQHAEPTTKVVVSAQDISAGTHLDRLIKAGEFRTLEVPDSVLVSGAVTSIDQLRGQTTGAPIYANEQIPTSRLVGIP